MAVNVRVNYQTEDADAKINATQSKLADNYKKLGDIAEKALKIENLKDAFGGVKDSVEVLTPLLGDTGAKVQKVSDSAFKLGQAGADIGSLWGPLGTLIGGALGAAGGAIVGYITDTSDAEEATRRLTEQIEAEAVSLDYLYEQWARAEAIKAGAFDVADGWTKLSEAIDATVHKQDLSVLSTEEVNKKLKEQGKLLDDGQATLQKKAREAEQIETEAQRLRERVAKDKTEQYEIDGLLSVQEEKLKKAKEELNTTTEHAATYLERYIELQAESDKRAAASTSEAKKSAAEKERLSKDAIRQAEEEAKALADLDKRVWASHQKYLEDKARAEAETADNIAKLQQKAAEDVAKAEQERIAARDKKLQEEADASYKKWKENQDRMLSDIEETTSQINAVMAPFADVLGKSFDLIAENIAKGEKPLKGFGGALRGYIADVLQAYAKKWGAQAIGELAEGIAWSVSPIPGGRDIAAGHFASAAAFGLAAAAAGGAGLIAGRNTQVPAPASEGDGGGGAGSYSSNPSLGSSDKGGSYTPGGNINVYMGGAPGSTTLYADDASDRATAPIGRRLKGIIGSHGRDLALDTGVD